MKKLNHLPVKGNKYVIYDKNNNVWRIDNIFLGEVRFKSKINSINLSHNVFSFSIPNSDIAICFSSNEFMELINNGLIAEQE